MAGSSSDKQTRPLRPQTCCTQGACLKSHCWQFNPTAIIVLRLHVHSLFSRVSYSASAFHQVGLYRRTGAGCLVCIIRASLRNQELQCNSRELVMDKNILLCAFTELLLLSSKRHYNPGIKAMNLGGWREISEVNSIGGSCRQPGFKFPAPTQYLSAACNSFSGLRRDQAYLANRHTCKTKHSYNKIFKRYKKKNKTMDLKQVT